MQRLYLARAVPAVRAGLELPNSQTAEHVTTTPGVESVAMMPFGNEGHYLIAVEAAADVHTTLAALPNVLALPENLDQNLTGVTALRTALEARNIPAHWISTSFTYRQALRIMVGIFQFAQVYHAETGRRLFQDAITLTTRMNQIPAAERTRLSDVAAKTGLDTSGVTGTTTIRQLLKLLGDQWVTRPIYLGVEI
jgi:hypothetical protein